MPIRATMSGSSRRSASGTDGSSSSCASGASAGGPNALSASCAARRTASSSSRVAIGRHQVHARRLGRGGDGVRGDLGILVGDQRRQIGQLGADVAGQAAEQHRRLDAGAAALRPALAGHRPEQHARRFEVLVAAGPAVERDHAGADREVGELAERVDLGERIDLGVVRQPEQRLGPHLDVGIVQQPLGLGPDRQVGRGPQGGQRPGADGGRLVGQERADGVERRPPPALREGPQHVQDGLGIAGVEGLGQHRRGRSIHRRRGRALDVEPVLVQAVRDRGHVAAAQHQRQADPDGAGDGAAGGEAAQAEAEAGDGDHADGEALRRQAEEQAADAVADAADEHVDGALDAGLHVRRQRQVEQLERRLVDREAQALIEGVGQHHRDEERRHHRQPSSRTGAPPAAAARSTPTPNRRSAGPVARELDDERRDAHAQVEGAEQAGQAIGVTGVALAGDQAELEPGPLGDDGDEEHHQRQRA